MPRGAWKRWTLRPLAVSALVLGMCGQAATAANAEMPYPPECMNDPGGGCLQGPLGSPAAGTIPTSTGTAPVLDTRWEGNTLFAQHRGHRVWAFRDPHRVGDENTWLIEVNRSVYETVGEAATSLQNSGAWETPVRCSNAGARQDVVECRL